MGFAFLVMKQNLSTKQIISIQNARAWDFMERQKYKYRMAGSKSIAF